MTHGRQADDPRACTICHFSFAMLDLDPIDDGLAWSLHRRRERPILFPALAKGARGVGRVESKIQNPHCRILAMNPIDLLPVVLSFAGTLVLTPLVGALA